MTEKEVEKAYKKMTESDAPDLWAKIESNLPEKEVRTEKKVRTGFFAKLGKIFSGGSTWKTSAAYKSMLFFSLLFQSENH